MHRPTGGGLDVKFLEILQPEEKYKGILEVKLDKCLRCTDPRMNEENSGETGLVWFCVRLLASGLGWEDVQKP